MAMIVVLLSIIVLIGVLLFVLRNVEQPIFRFAFLKPKERMLDEEQTEEIDFDDCTHLQCADGRQIIIYPNGESITIDLNPQEE